MTQQRMNCKNNRIDFSALSDPVASLWVRAHCPKQQLETEPLQMKEIT